MLSSLRARAVATRGAIDRPIAVLALLAFISQLGVSIMLPLLPLYAVEVGATPEQLGLMVSAFSVTATLGQLSVGFLGPYISPRRQMPLGQAIYAAGNFLIATTASAIPLIAFRAMSGIGGGMTIISERLYVARVTAQSRLAFVNGVLSAAGSSGSVLGPLVGAVLAAGSLRAPFVVVGITASVAAVAALAFLPAERRHEDGSAATAAPDDGNQPVGAETAAGAGRWSSMAPLVRLGLWSVFFNASYGAWITTFAPYSADALGLEPSYVALYFIPFGLGAIVLGPALARVADRTGRRRMVAIGTAMIFASLGALVLAAPLWLIYATAFVAGGGISSAQSSWFALLGVATDSGRRGRSFGLVSALSNLGVIAGATAASTVWAAVGLREGLLTAAGFLALAGASLVLVPSDRGRA